MFCSSDILEGPRVTSVNSGKDWLQCQQSWSPSSFPPYLAIPPCLPSLLFPFLSALHSKKSTVTDPPVHTNYRKEKGDESFHLSIYQDQKLMKCVEPWVFWGQYYYSVNVNTCFRDVFRGEKRVDLHWMNWLNACVWSVQSRECNDFELKCFL